MSKVEGPLQPRVPPQGDAPGFRAPASEDLDSEFDSWFDEDSGGAFARGDDGVDLGSPEADAEPPGFGDDDDAMPDALELIGPPPVAPEPPAPELATSPAAADVPPPAPDAPADPLDELWTRARALVARSVEQRERAEVLTHRVTAAMAHSVPWADGSRRLTALGQADEARALSLEADVLADRARALLERAVHQEPSRGDVRGELIRELLSEHQLAERSQRHHRAEHLLPLIRRHARKLAPSDPLREAALDHLRGEGTLTLRVDPPGAEVHLHRYERAARRPQPVEPALIGRAPLEASPLPMGSYLLTLVAPGRVPVRYPVDIGRGEAWSGCAPGEQEPEAVRLPDASALGFEDVVVPAGWFVAGGTDPGALPAARLWCESFVARRHPVRVGEFLRFVEERARRAGESVPAALRDADPELPMVGVDWFTARAFAAWEARRTGEPWRLPCEREWEKLARGVDGRRFPWGDTTEPGWAHTADAVERPALGRVGSGMHDTSPYGVTDLAGNVRVWCLDAYQWRGSEVVGRWVRLPPDDAPDAPRVIRGGSWRDVGARAVPLRSFSEPRRRADDVGLRLVRS